MTGRENTVAAYHHYLKAEQDSQVMIRDARSITKHAPRKILGILLAIPGILALAAAIIAMIVGTIDNSIMASIAVSAAGLIAISGGIIIQKADDTLDAIKKSATHLSQTRRNDYMDAVANEVRSYGFTTYRTDYPTQTIYTDHGAITSAVDDFAKNPFLLLNGQELIIPS